MISSPVRSSRCCTVQRETRATKALRERLVREAAYFRAERRGFRPGREIEDWIAAEREVDERLEAGEVAPIRFVY